MRGLSHLWRKESVDERANEVNGWPVLESGTPKGLKLKWSFRVNNNGVRQNLISFFFGLAGMQMYIGVALFLAIPNPRRPLQYPTAI